MYIAIKNKLEEPTGQGYCNIGTVLTTSNKSHDSNKQGLLLH